MKEHVLQVWKHTITLTEQRQALLAALRVAFCLAVPLVLLAVAGRLDWAMYAAFGAFSSVYGRSANHGIRLGMQLSAGFTLLSIMLVATLASWLELSFPAHLVLLSLIAFGSNWLSRGLGWSPPGPIFAVFAGGACAAVPATAQAFLGIFVAGLGTIIFSVLVMLALSTRTAALKDTLSTPLRWHKNPIGLKESGLMALATAVAGTLSYALGAEHWYWASLAGISAVTGANAHSRVSRGIQRCLGTCVGVALTGLIFVVDPPVWVLLVVALLCQFLIEMSILRNYAIGMIFMTVVALLMIHLVSPEPAMSLVTARLSTTAFGALIGCLLSIGLGIWASNRRKVQ